MEINWHGNTCFTFKDKKTRIVINPDKSIENLKGEVVLTSLKDADTGKVEGAYKIIKWPGEYELQDVPIKGFLAWTKSKSKEEAEGTAGDRTIIFNFEIGGIKCCHLDNLGHVLTSDTIKEIGDIDILMINVGEDSNLGLKKAMEIIESMEPRAIIPMGKGSFSEALKEFGATGIEPQEKFEIKSLEELPEDKRLYIILKK